MPRTSRPLQVHPIVLRRAHVLQVRDVTPTMRRLTLGGADLRAGTMGEGFDRPAFVSDGFDDHVKLVFPPKDGQLPPVGRQEETRFAWNPEVLQFTRDYTVRAVDDEAGTFDIDVVRHDGGLAAGWAYRAQPGDQIDFAGPKSCALLNREVDWHLLIGDETALPAIGRFLEEAPEGLAVRAIVEIPSAADQQQIPTRADARVEWLCRGEIPPGRSTLLLEAVRSLDLPEGRGYIWCAGEALTIAPIRRHLRGLGLDREDIEVVGYWRRPTEPGAGEEPHRAPTIQVMRDVHAMTELLPPVVTRVAATLGIGGHVGAGVTDPAALSAATGVRESLLRPLLEAMRALGLLTETNGQLANTAHGAVLAEPEAVDELTLDNPANRRVLALVDLLDVLRTGRASARGEDSAALADAAREQTADELYYILEPVGRLPEVAGADRLTVVGPTADLAAPHLLAAAPGARRTRTLTDAIDHGWEEHDCAVLLGALEGRSEAEATLLLQQGLKHGPVLVVVERNHDRAGEDDHAAERVLTELALTGVPARTGAHLERLLREAGATTIRTAQVGWGFGSYNRAIIAHG